MAKVKEYAIGTEDLIGATVTSVNWDELLLEKDGRNLKLSLEYEYSYNTCMCDEVCYCSHENSTAYFRANEFK